MSDLAAHFSAAATSADCIHVKNIQLSSPVSAPDVWGNLKEQPALVSVHLSLTKGFSTASDADKLDDSTIHYGNLTKRIRSNCGQDCITLDQVLAATESAIHGLALKTNDNFIVARSAVEVHLPKASMLGTEVVVTSTTSYDQTGKSCDVMRIFSVKDVTIPTLIGVNAYERTMKQPLVVSFTLQYTHCSSSSFDERHQKALFDVEKTLVQIIQDTTYETLETLVEFVYMQLIQRLPEVLSPGTKFSLRVEKPRAIAMADAPIIEIMRTVSSNETSNKQDAAAASSD